MVVINVGDGRDERFFYHVGGVISAAQARLQHRVFALGFFKIQKSHGQKSFKIRRPAVRGFFIGPVHFGFNDFHQVGKVVRRNVFVVDFDSFNRRGRMRRVVRADFFAGQGQDLVDGGGGGAFAGRAGDVDVFKAVMRIVQGI